MSVRKEDLYRLLDQIDSKEYTSLHELLKRIVNKEAVIVDGMIVEYDDSPMSKEEKVEVEHAREQIEKGEYVDWEDIKNELKL